MACGTFGLQTLGTPARCSTCTRSSPRRLRQARACAEVLALGLWNDDDDHDVDDDDIDHDAAAADDDDDDDNEDDDDNDEGASRLRRQ